MKRSLYPRLAWTGIVKNKVLYLPYIVSCIGSVAVLHVLQCLSYSTLLKEMRGGRSTEAILSLGKIVIAIFSVIFLLYASSFLLKRRFREFGLYYVLGMDKKGICAVAAWESLILAGIGIGGGLLTGALFSKAAELVLARLVQGEAGFRPSFTLESFTFTFSVCLVIFFIVFLRSIFTVLRSDPIGLLKSENLGEKPPRSNPILAIAGLLCIVTAYVMAVSIESPLNALIFFFVAVILVIIGTYLLFIAGSVTLCRLLKKNKKYYYRKDHFVSVSSMLFRMKRNGAGLASVCILSTMVLVMISSTSALYFGKEDNLRRSYPNDVTVSLMMDGTESLTEENLTAIRSSYEKVIADRGIEPTAVREYTYSGISGTLSGNHISVRPSDFYDPSALDALRTLFFFPLADYNRVADDDLTLGKGEAAIYVISGKYEQDTIRVENTEWKLVTRLSSFFPFEDTELSLNPTYFLVIPDNSELHELNGLRDDYGNPMLDVRYYYGVDMKDADLEAFSVSDMTEPLHSMELFRDGMGYSCGNIADARGDFIASFGGLFFIGLLLSAVFIAAAAMIVYYKQLTEGFEDQARFGIMQKVGMTKEDIRAGIRSQTRTVFFAPLLFAGVHLSFAFPMVWKLLMLFGLRDMTFAILTTLIAFGVFCLFYALIYRLTARTYYKIVSESL